MKRLLPERPLWAPLLLHVAPVLIYFTLAAHAFELLGISTGGAYLLIGASLAGSLVNLPLNSGSVVRRKDPTGSESALLG